MASWYRALGEAIYAGDGPALALRWSRCTYCRPTRPLLNKPIAPQGYLMETSASRREFLSSAAFSASLLGGLQLSPFVFGAEAETEKGAPITARDYLQSILYKREDVEKWLAQKDYPFSKYDSELG